MNKTVVQKGAEVLEHVDLYRCLLLFVSHLPWTCFIVFLFLECLDFIDRAAWTRSNYVTGSPRMEELGHSGRNISFCKTEMKHRKKTRKKS